MRPAAVKNTIAAAIVLSLGLAGGTATFADDSPDLTQPLGAHSVVSTSDGGIRDNELADFLRDQIIANGGKVKDVKIIANCCYGGGLLDDFERVLNDLGVPWVAGAASEADQTANGWTDKTVEAYGGEIGSGFTDALFGPRNGPKDRHPGTARDEGTHNVKEDLDAAVDLDAFGPVGWGDEDPVVAWGGGGENINWHEPGTKHKAVVFGGSQTNTRHHNNIKNVKEALEGLWPDGTHNIQAIDGGTKKNLLDAIEQACKNIDKDTQLLLYIDDHGSPAFDFGEFLGWVLPYMLSSPLDVSFGLHDGWAEGLEAMHNQGEEPTLALNIILGQPVETTDWDIQFNGTDIEWPAGQVGFDVQIPVDWQIIVPGDNRLQILPNGTPDEPMVLNGLTLEGPPIDVGVDQPDAVDVPPITWLQFDEGAGYTAYDCTLNGNNGQINGNPSWVPGFAGGAGDSALHLDGIDDHVVVPGFALPASTDILTFSALVIPDPDVPPPGGPRAVVSILDSLDLTAHGGTATLTSPGSDETIQGQEQLNTETPNRIDIELNGTDPDNPQARFFVNGFEEGVMNMPPGSTPFLGGSPDDPPADLPDFIIGGTPPADPSTDPLPFMGTIDDVMITPGPYGGPFTPREPSPTSGQTVAPDFVTLQWILNAPDAEVSYQQVLFGTDPANLQVIATAGPGDRAVNLVDGVDPDATYYWAVRVYGRCTQLLAESPLWRLNTENPGAHNLTPVDGDFIHKADAVLKWDADGATSSTVYIGTNREFVERRFWPTYLTTTTANSFDASAFVQPNTVVYWAVDTNTDGRSYTGQLNSFTVVPDDVDNGAARFFCEIFTDKDTPTKEQATDNPIAEDQVSGNLDIWFGNDAPAPGVPADNHAQLIVGEVYTPKQGKYAYRVGSDDGSVLVIGDVETYNWRRQPFTYALLTADLPEGWNPFFALQFDALGGSGLSVEVKGPDDDDFTPLGDANTRPSPRTIPLINGSPGMDVLRGGDDDDDLSGDDGQDDLSGGDGQDALLGGSADPHIKAIPGFGGTGVRPFFGSDLDAVRNAAEGSPEDLGITDCDPTKYPHPIFVDLPGPLALDTKHYVRLDTVTPGGTTPGDVYPLLTPPYLLLVDDEQFDELGNPVYFNLQDGHVNGTGSRVGYIETPYTEQTVVKDGDKSIPWFFDNGGEHPDTGETVSPHSEATYLFRTFQDDLPGLVDGSADATIRMSFKAPDSGSTNEDEATGTFTVIGGGNDIWGNADEFQFAYRELNGDGSVVAKVDSMTATATNSWAKAGVMVRDTSAPDSKHVSILMTAKNGLIVEHRDETGAATSGFSYGATFPMWLKVRRTGDSFWLGFSENGDDFLGWTLEDEVPMNSHIGLAVTSHHRSAMCTAVFSDVEVTGDVSGEWQSQDIGIKKNDAEQLYMALEDSDGHVKVVNHPDPCATTLETWQEWRIPLREFSDGGVDINNVAKLHIGVGDRDDPQPGGSGRLFFDDIGLHMPEILKMRLVARAEPSDWAATTLPEHESTYHQWQTFYLELWAQTEYLEAGSDALCSAFADVELTDGIASAESVAHSPDFASLATGTIEDSRIDELGGCTLTGGLGISPQWALIARVEMTARAEGQTTASLSLADTDSSIIGHGAVPWYQINLGSCEVTVGAKPQTSVYDLDGDGTIGPGDFSLFILYWLQPVSDSNGDAMVSSDECDFDGDGFVGPGDLSWFATAWLKPWDDPSIQYPPDDSEQPVFGMLFATAPGAADVEVRPVIVTSPSASDSTQILPASISSVAQGQDYYVEIWAGDTGSINTGLTSVYVNLDVSAGVSASIQSIDHGGVFTVFTSGTITAGGIEELGGSSLAAAGIEPQWVRVATVKMRAEASGPVYCSLAPSTVGVAALGRGVVPWSQIALGSEDECFPPVYSAHNDWVALGRPACWCWPYQCDGDADGAAQGLRHYRVSTNDLDALIKSWQKPTADPDFDPCADFDHKAEGLAERRVGTKDLDILIANWKKKDTDLPGDCPRDE